MIDPIQPIQVSLKMEDLIMEQSQGKEYLEKYFLLLREKYLKMGMIMLRVY